MKKDTVKKNNSSATHRGVQRSTTLSRKYVKRPTRVLDFKAPKKAPKKVEITEPVVEKTVKIAKKPTSVDQAAKSVLKDVATMEEPELSKTAFKKKHKSHRFALAFACSLLTVGGLAAFVHFNMPDISVRVAAMQSGIEANYPSFVPRNYSLSNVTSDKEGQITMYFTGPENSGFTLTEEKSTWDSTAVLNNYVKKYFETDYSTLKEQGITIYAGGADAAWVNGGILYKLKATGTYLTKEQIRNIVVSL